MNDKSVRLRIFRMSALFAVTVAVACMLGITGCPHAIPKSCDCENFGYDPAIDPNDFVDVIDNPYFPHIPGTTRVYEAETDEGTERTVVEVLHKTKKILGVNCTIVRDTVTLDDEFVEDTYDWFAQDKEGNVWYFGEATMEFEDGIVTSNHGAWEAGVHCAKPGIIMQADPVVGDTYLQEYYACVAEDMATVLALDVETTVEYGSFKNCLKTFDFTPLDPAAEEKKIYAPGVGHILTLEGGERAEELVSVTME